LAGDARGQRCRPFPLRQRRPASLALALTDDDQKPIGDASYDIMPSKRAREIYLETYM
jgi:hypothetical protein